MADQITAYNWLIIALALLASYFIVSVTYNLCFHPLANYPGPFLAKISALPNYYYATTGYRHIWLWQYHEIYGETVRFKPDGIIFNSPEAFRAINETRANVKKGNFYRVWARSSRDENTAYTVDKMIHERKRRVLNGVFSEKAICSAGVFITKHVDRWNDLLLTDNDGKVWSSPQNMCDLTDYLAFDIMGDLCFGRSFDLKEPGENKFRHIPHTIAYYLQFLYPITQSPILNFWVWLKPRGLDRLFKWILPNSIKEYYAFVEASVKLRAQEEAALQQSGIEGKRKDMFHYLFNAADDAGNPGYSTQELYAEANHLIITGSDTTATTIVGFWFYLLRNPRVSAKLVEEIRTVFNSTDEIELGAKLTSCEYLRACIDESLRMAPIGRRELPLPGGLLVGNTHIPAGTHVGVAAWSLHHNQKLFKDPWIFRPERWIPKDGVSEEEVLQVRNSFHTFSMGQYNCVGQKLAMSEMMVTFAKTLWRMDVRLLPEDGTGGGREELGWGRRNEEQIDFKDAHISIKDGPVVQFRRRRV